MAASVTVRQVIAIMLALACQMTAVQSLLCYRCDSLFNEDCLFYPSPMSTYEDCDERPHRVRKEYKQAIFPGKAHEKFEAEEKASQTIFIRYRYKVCPLMERTIKQVVQMSPSPMENANYICGKAVTHGSNGIRVRRGCTPDLFLSGISACVSISPWGQTDTACFCATDLCNHSSSLVHNQSSTCNILVFLTMYGLVAAILS